MNKTSINDLQSIIEEQKGDYIFRFTDTSLNGNHEIKLNEIAKIQYGKSKFIWSDDTSISIVKNFSSDFSDEDLKEFISELRIAFNLTF